MWDIFFVLNKKQWFIEGFLFEFSPVFIIWGKIKDQNEDQKVGKKWLKATNYIWIRKIWIIQESKEFKKFLHKHCRLLPFWKSKIDKLMSLNSKKSLIKIIYDSNLKVQFKRRLRKVK